MIKELMIIYNMWKINWPHKYSFQEYMESGAYAPFLTMGFLALPLLIPAYYSNGKIFEANIKNNGDFWKTLEEPFIHFYGYNSHFKDEKGGKALLDTFVGIDENGDLSIGNMMVNLLSVFISIGIASRITFRTKHNMVKVLYNNKYFKNFLKYSNFIKNNFFDMFSVISNPLNVFNVLLGRVGKKFVDDSSNLVNVVYSFFYNDVRNMFYFLNPTNQKNTNNNLKHSCLKKIDSSKFRDIASHTISKLNSSIKNIKNKLQKVVRNVKSKISKLVKKVNTVIKKIKNKFKNIVKNVKSAIKIVKKKVNKLVKKVKNTIKKVTKKVDKLVKNVKSTVKKIQTRANKVVKNIKSTVNNIKNKTEAILKNQVNKLVKKVKNTAKKVKNTVKKIQSKTKVIVKKVKKTVKQIKIKSKKVVHTVKSTVQYFKNKVANGISKVYTGGKRIVTKSYVTGKRIVTNAYNRGKKIISDVYNTGKRLFTNVYNGLKKFIIR